MNKEKYGCAVSQPTIIGWRKFHALTAVKDFDIEFRLHLVKPKVVNLQQNPTNYTGMQEIRLWEP